MDYVAYALDPDGHCIQLYYYMEQIGWDGRSRPQSQRRQATGEWPRPWSRCPIRTRTRCIRGHLGDKSWQILAQQVMTAFKSLSQ